MKKVILLVLALVNFGFGVFFTNAQTEVVEFTIAGETQSPSGHYCYSLLVLDGHYGKFKLNLRNGEKYMYDAFWTEDAYSNNIIKLTPTIDGLNNATICFYSNGNYFKIGSSVWEIIKTDFIPKNEWNGKLAEYHMNGEYGQTLGAYTGLVVDPQKNPIPSVSVTVKASDGRKYYGFTNNDGIFEIDGCPLGDLVITVEKDSYKSGYVKTNYKENDFGLLCITMNKSDQYSSNSSSNGSAVGDLIAGAVVGATIIKGVASAFKKSSSSSSSSSNSNNSNKNTNTEPGRRIYNNVEIINVSKKSGSVFNSPYAWIKIRNKNPYSVVVKVQCRFFSDWPSDGRYTKEVTIPASEIREVEIMGPQGRYDYQDVRIVTVY